MDSIIQVDHLVKKYKKSQVNAVDDISFDVREGEFFTFLGPNGAGKTTTISILTTMLSKTSGDIKVAGFDLQKQSSKVRRNIGIIFQNPSLDLNLSAEENIRFHATLYGIYPFGLTFKLMPKAYQDRVMELAKVLGIEKDIFKAVKTFSGGMKRKLEILRSLMHHPKILFLDEPTTGLDPLSRRNLWEYIKEVREKEKTTVFLTTHYLEEAEESDRVCIINHGKIVALGTPDEIKKKLINRYLVINSKNKKELRDDLGKNKIKFEENENFKIAIKDDGDAQRIIQKIKTPLSHIEVHIPSLEDAYLSIVEEKEEK